jgi:hypothetical protein
MERVKEPLSPYEGGYTSLNRIILYEMDARDCYRKAKHRFASLRLTTNRRLELSGGESRGRNSILFMAAGLISKTAGEDAVGARNRSGAGFLSKGRDTVDSGGIRFDQPR